MSDVTASSVTAKCGEVGRPEHTQGSWETRDPGYWVEVPMRVLMLVDPASGPLRLRFDFYDGDRRSISVSDRSLIARSMVRTFHEKAELGGFAPW